GGLALIFFGLYAMIFLRTVGGHLSIGQMVMLVQLMAMARQPVTSLSWVVDSAQRAIAGSKSYCEVMALDPGQVARAGERATAQHDVAAAPARASGQAGVAPGAGGADRSTAAAGAAATASLEMSLQSAGSAPAGEVAVGGEAIHDGAVRGEAAVLTATAPPTSSAGDATITFEDVHFGYDEEADVIDGISFHLSPGDRVALVGESGGGKTTIVNLLLGLYRMRSGRIEVAGVDVGAGNLAELRRRVGVVFQDASLFSGTIRENIVYGAPEATDEQVVDVAERAAVTEFVRKLPDGFDTVIG